MKMPTRRVRCGRATLRPILAACACLVALALAPDARADNPAPQEISVASDDNQPVRMPADGRTAKWTREDGEVFDVAAHRTSDRLLQSFKAADGERTNTATLGPDGRALDCRSR